MNNPALKAHLYRTVTLVAESQQLALREAGGRLAGKCREIGLTQDQLIVLTNVLRNMDREIGDADRGFRLTLEVAGC